MESHFDEVNLSSDKSFMKQCEPNGSWSFKQLIYPIFIRKNHYGNQIVQDKREE